MLEGENERGAEQHHPMALSVIVQIPICRSDDSMVQFSCPLVFVELPGVQPAAQILKQGPLSSPLDNGSFLCYDSI